MLSTDLTRLTTDEYYSREEFRQWCEAQTKGRSDRVDGQIVARSLPWHLSAARTFESKEQFISCWTGQ
jgi:Uma2 family endonuclease